MDTVRMIAYRAETVMMGLVTGFGLSPSAARRLLQDLFVTEADILPDTENNRLTVRVHNASRPAADRALEQLLEHLNCRSIQLPGTQEAVSATKTRATGKGMIKCRVSPLRVFLRLNVCSWPESMTDIIHTFAGFYLANGKQGTSCALE